MDRPELIRIDREAGVYWWRVDGREEAYPSVTHILETVFRPYRGNSEYALQRGNAVHKAIALLEGFGDGSGLAGGVEALDERLRPYVDGWMEFKAKADVEIISCERPVLDSDYEYCGTPDFVANVHGWRSIIDVKSGGTAPLVWLQLSGYQSAVNSEDGKKPTGAKRFALYLPGNGKFKLRESPDDDTEDFATFLCALDVYRYMRRRLNG